MGDAVSQGHPDLMAKIAEEIRSSGPITFARFMEFALYEPTHGYYMRGGSGQNKIGWDGDFYTSSDVHPVFALALARQIHQLDEILERPDPFTLVEMGPGTGALARDLLTACAKLDHSLATRLHCVLVERSPAFRELQGSAMAALPSSVDRVTWVDSLQALASNSVVGLLLSNELVDAFPVHRVTVDRGELKEIHVDVEEGRFRERLLPLSTLELSHYLERMAIKLEDGQVAEINLQALTWMGEVARVLTKGLVITVDYGHNAQDLYSSDRRKGTLLCYHRHTVSDDPYQRIGLQDMTAHVDFTSLAHQGEEAGLSVTGFTNQLGFLAGLRIEEILGDLDPHSGEYRSVVELIRPHGMGRTFKILIQHKGMEPPELDGLAYKPFFASALTAPA